MRTFLLWSMNSRGNSKRIVTTTQTPVIRAHMRSKPVRKLRKKGFVYLQVIEDGTIRYWSWISGKFYRGDMRRAVRSLLRAS